MMTLINNLNIFLSNAHVLTYVLECVVYINQIHIHVKIVAYFNQILS